MAQFRIGERVVGDDQPCYIIAEAGMAHEGSLGVAMSYVRAAKAAGADAVKFQMHYPTWEGTASEHFRNAVSFLQDSSRSEYWGRTSFTSQDWLKLQGYCRGEKIDFLCSAFSREAVKALTRMNVQAYKIPSGQVVNQELLSEIASTGKPALLSTGMSTWDEVDAALRALVSCPVAVLQCTSMYPVPPGKWGLAHIWAIIKCMKDVVPGFSDHSGGIAAGISAVAWGAKVLEVHLALTRHGFGPDIPASLEPGELTLLVRSIRDLETELQSRLSKNDTARELNAMRKVFMPSLQPDGRWLKSNEGVEIR